MVEALYGGNFEDRECVEMDFGKVLSSDIEILVALTDYFNDEVDLLFRRDGKIYEVHAEDWNQDEGLKGKWKPKETTISDFVKSVTSGPRLSYFTLDFRYEVCTFLEGLDNENGKTEK